MYDKYMKNGKFDLTNDEDLVKIGTALSCKTRIDILRLVTSTPMTITELSRKLYISTSATMFHVKLLEDARFVRTDYIAGKRNTRLIVSDMRTCSFDFAPQPIDYAKNESVSFEMPIGLYTDAHFKTRMGIILNNGDPLYDIFAAERINAYIIWVDGGSVDYTFPCRFLQDKHITELYFTLEICAEAPQYRNDWKSDITFSLDDKELGTFTSPSDFGGKRGKLNPSWWLDDFTQYGQLVKVAVTEHGSYINGMRCGDTTLNDIALKNKNKCVLRIESKETAKNAGGFNLFSKHFGDYEQDIIMTAVYDAPQ